MITNQLPAGLTDKSAELYSLNNVLMALTDGVNRPAIEFDYVKNPILTHMMSRPLAHKKVQEWVGNDIDGQISRYGQCLWGTFNTIPDLCKDGKLSDPEYINCDQKGKCKYEKDVCTCFKIDENTFLSKAEERIIPFVLLSDRAIGATLHVSPHTATTQIKSVKNKLNIQTKAYVVDWANKNGIILCK